MNHIHKKKLLFFYLCAQSLFVCAGPVSWFQSCGQSIKNIFARLQHKNIVTKKNIGIAAGCALGVYWVYKQCIAKKQHILSPARDYLFLRNDNNDNISGIKTVPCLQQEKLAVAACRDLKIDGESAASVIGKIDGATCGYHALKNACIALDEYYKGGRSQSWLSTVQSRAQESRLYAQFMQGALPYIKENRTEINKRRPSMNLRLNDQGNWLEEGEIAGSPRSLLSNLGHGNTEATFQNAQAVWNETFSSLFSHIPGHIQDHVTVISQLEPFNVHKLISDSSSIDGRVGHILQSLQAACNAAEDSNLDKAKYMHCFIVNTSCQNSSMNAHSGVHYVLYVVYVDGGTIQSCTMNSIEGITCDGALAVLKDNYVDNVKENVAKFSAQDYMHRWQQAYNRFEAAMNKNNTRSIVEVLESGDLSLFKEVDQSKANLRPMIQNLADLLRNCLSSDYDSPNIGRSVQRLQEDINNFINGEQLVVRRSDQNEEKKEEY